MSNIFSELLLDQEPRTNSKSHSIYGWDELIISIDSVEISSGSNHPIGMVASGIVADNYGS